MSLDQKIPFDQKDITIELLEQYDSSTSYLFLYSRGKEIYSMILYIPYQTQGVAYIDSCSKNFLDENLEMPILKGFIDVLGHHTFHQESLPTLGIHTQNIGQSLLLKLFSLGFVQIDPEIIGLNIFLKEVRGSRIKTDLFVRWMLAFLCFLLLLLSFLNWILFDIYIALFGFDFILIYIFYKCVSK